MICTKVSLYKFQLLLEIALQSTLTYKENSLPTHILLMYDVVLSKQKYIVNCQKEVEPPAYVHEHGTFDLTPIMKNTRWTPTARYNKKKLKKF